MLASSSYTITDFSNHLFWDFDRNNINPDKPNGQVVQRVLEYGFLKDWVILTHIYSLDDILQAAMNLRDIDAKSMAFLINISGVSKEEFRCYTTKQSTPPHWNF